MAGVKDFTVRSVRMPLELDAQIKQIAEYEDRTISKVIQRLLESAVFEYYKKHAFGEVPEE